MRKGASGVCKSKTGFEGKVTKECASAEIRHTGLYPEVFNRNVDFCLKNNIYIIANILLRKGEDDDKFYSEQEWRRHVDGIVDSMLKKEPTATRWRITIGNEPAKYMSKEKYAWYINIACDQIKIKRGYKHVKIGAGNEELHKTEMYEYILKNCPLLDYLDIHIQAAVINPTTMRVMDGALDYYGNVAKAWAIKYNLKLSCTEANWCNVSKKEGYEDLMKMYNKALEIGCEDFDVVFIDYSGNDKYEWLSFNIDGKERSPYWEEFKELMIKDNKPVETEEEDMKLERFYYRNRPVSLIKNDPKGYGIMFLRACFGLFHSNVFDEALEIKVRQYQIDNNLLVDGKVGPETFGNMIKVEDFYKHYCWVHSLWARGLT